MEITEVQVKLVGDSADRLKASCSVTIDGEFVVRDVKVIEGTSGLFVAMPSRKLTDHCPQCRHKNHLRARFCNHCGAKLGEDRAARRGRGPAQLHADIAHPINSACRDRIQTRVVEEYQRETELSKSPGYRPKQFDAAEATEVTEATGAKTGEIGDLIEELKQDAEKRRNDTADRPGAGEGEPAGEAPSAGAGEAAGETEAPTAPDQDRPPDEDREQDDEFGAGLF